MEQHWCMCIELKGVARDVFSTCMICGGKDAYGGNLNRGSKYHKNIHIPKMNMVQEIPNSHYWDSLDMMIAFFKFAEHIDRDYVLTGLRNMKEHGYKIVKEETKPLANGE